MKIINTLFFLVLAFKIYSQKDTILHIHKFPNGKTSTIVVIKDDREGYAKAYDFKGQVIYHNYIRRFAGHASVTFKHHPNGMVKEAHFSSHPDAGIQWYNTWTSFDEQGNKIGERHSNWDDRVTVPTYHLPDSVFRQIPLPKQQPTVLPQQPQPQQPQPVQPTQPQKKEIVTCASVHKNLTQFVNHSKQRILLNISYAGKDTLIMLKPKQTFKGPSYISAQISSPMNHNVRFSFNSTNKKFVIDSVYAPLPQGELETLHQVHFYARRK